MKELLPVIYIYRHMGETVADNAAVVSVINTESSKCEQVMHLRRSLVFFRANGNIFLSAKHIPGWTTWQQTHYPVITCHHLLPRQHHRH